MKTKSTFIAALLTCLTTLAAAQLSAADRPNIVLIMADDNDQLSWAISGNCCEFL
jgi:hypothetical protein